MRTAEDSEDAEEFQLHPVRMTASATLGIIPPYLNFLFSRSKMAIKSDKWIRKMAREHDMINPFSEKQVRAGVVSYGLSSYGYDLRVADEFKIFTNVNSAIIDPKKFDERSFVTISSDCCLVPPNSFALARSVE